MNRSDLSSWRRKILVPLVGAILASNCTVGPDFEPPVAPLEPSWYQEAREGLAPTEIELVTWWKVFDDPVPPEESANRVLLPDAQGDS